MADGEVQFQSPTTGAVQGVPAEQWDEALKQGYKPVSHKVMYSPEGKRGMVANADVPQYARDGYQTTPKTEFQEKTTGGERGVSSGLRVTDFFKGLAKTVGDVATGGMLSPAIDAVQGKKPGEDARELVKQTPANYEAGKASMQEAVDAGVPRALRNPAFPQEMTDIDRKIAPYVGGGAGSVAPIVGVSPQSQRERAERADTGGIIGENIIPTASVLLPEVARIPAVRNVAKAAGSALAESKVGRGVSSAIDRVRVPEAQKAMTQAIQPGVNIPKAQESISIAGPRMQQIRTARGIEIPEKGPEALKATLDLNREAKAQILGEIEKRMGPVADLRPNAKSVADAIRGSVDEITVERTPGAKEAVETAAKAYEKEGGWTIRQMENRMHTLNRNLGRIYSQPVPGGVSIPVSAEMDLAEAGALRTLIDESVERLSGEGVKDLKREYGAQRDVEKALARQYAVATRTKNVPLWEGLAYLQAAGDFASGGVLGAAKAAGKIAIGNRLQTLRDPGYLLNQSFHGPRPFKAAEPFGEFTPPAPKALLPAPKERLPETTDAGDAERLKNDTSGPVREGRRFITPRALLPDPSITPVEFLGERPRGRNLAAAAGGAFAKSAPAGFENLLKETGWEYGGKNSMGIHEFKEPGSNISISVTDKNMSPDAVRERMSAKLREFGRPGLGEPGRVAPQFAREETRPLESSSERDPEAQLGPMGRGGVRQPIKGRLPGQSMDEAKLLVQQTLDVMRSGDRPGRYYDQIESTAQGRAGGWKRGLRMGGQWRGVGSMRDMLPWAKENDFTPSEMENALRLFEKGKINRVMKSAMEFVEREQRARSLGRAAGGALREPGEDEEEFKGEGGETPF